MTTDPRATAALEAAKAQIDANRGGYTSLTNQGRSDYLMGLCQRVLAQGGIPGYGEWLGYGLIAYLGALAPAPDAPPSFTNGSVSSPSQEGQADGPH